MTRFHFTNGLLISTLALAAAACSSDSKTTATTTDGGTGGTGGSTSSSGGSTSSSGGAKSTGGTTGTTGGTTGSTGGAKATGGTTGSTGGAKSTGGTTGDSGTETDGAAATTATCEGYCTANVAACTGANKQYDSKAACLTACANFPATGHDGDTAGNTLQCRIYHTTAAANGTDADKTLHCPHTGITPTAYCK